MDDEPVAAGIPTVPPGRRGLSGFVHGLGHVPSDALDSASEGGSRVRRFPISIRSPRSVTGCGRRDGGRGQATLATRSPARAVARRFRAAAREEAKGGRVRA
ncbi:hypothetical protein GCM10029976_046520 [Kribbella albertanoniae]